MGTFAKIIFTLLILCLISWVSIIPQTPISDYGVKIMGSWNLLAFTVMGSWILLFAVIILIGIWRKDDGR